MTNEQLTAAWNKRDSAGSPVAPGWIDGKGQDSDFMTIQFDGSAARTWERRAGATVWEEVTTSPVPAQRLKP